VVIISPFCYAFMMTNGNNPKDQVFSTPMENIGPFSFNQDVADVFDDMVSRSIPFYKEIHSLICDMVLRNYKGQGIIYDLGCSTGTTIKLLGQHLKEADRPYQFVGVDTSSEMLGKAKEKCHDIGNTTFRCEDMTEVDFQNAEVVILNYTLQFLKVEKRKDLLKKIYQALRPGGIILLSEKIKSPLTEVESLITDLYYDFKRRNGYSELEISQKREALENVLIPLTPEEQLKDLKLSGFENSEMLFRWYNFASYVGIKKHV